MAATAPPRVLPTRLLIPLLIGGAVALAIGVYGNEHTPTGRSILGDGLFFSNTLAFKAWFATAAIVLAVFQIFSSLRMYDKIRIPRTKPAWLGNTHRMTGTLAFLFSVPVAYHCLWALGFQTMTTRVAIHSIAGCFFYGAFAAKIAIVESKRLPGIALPIAGGTLFAGLVVVWWTSSLWYFDNIGFPEF